MAQFPHRTPPPREIAATVSLGTPIKVYGELASELSLTELRAADLIACDGLGDMAKMAKLIERMAAIPRSSVEQLTARDFLRVSEVVNGFLDSGEKDATETDDPPAGP